MLLEMAIGDAYGAGREYLPEDADLNNDGETYMQHPKWTELKPGRYTDDTQMCIALAELMLLKNPDRWTTWDVVRAFVGQFARDPRPGYSSRFYDVMLACSEANRDNCLEDGVEFFLQLVTPHSNRSGGAMRAPVIGLISDTQRVIDLAMMQASVTHATQDGMNAAAASALMAHYFYHNIGGVDELEGFLSHQIPGVSWNRPVWEGRVLKPGLQHVKAALAALTSHRSVDQVLKHSISYGGDVDTVAAIAVFAASVSWYHRSDLDMELHRSLENGDYGYDYLRNLDIELVRKYEPKA